MQISSIITALSDSIDQGLLETKATREQITEAIKARFLAGGSGSAAAKGVWK